MSLTLAEWQTSSPQQVNAAERHVLESIFEAAVRPVPSPGCFRVTPGNVVGSVRVGERAIVVVPKIPIDRVLFMTAYAADPYGWRDGWTAIRGVDDLVDGMAALFIRSCEVTVERGLLRSYRRIDNDDRVIRGRIRWPVQARRITPLPIAIRHAVHDEDVLENRILRATVAILRETVIKDRGVAASVHRMWLRLRDLTPLPDAAEWVGRISWTRQNEHYRLLLALAAVILQRRSLDLGSGRVPVLGFTLRLYDVFEQFVRVALAEAAGLTAAEFSTGKSQDLTLDEAQSVSLYPDLAWRVGSRWLFVGDVKYKVDDGQGHEKDLYQLLTYATATGLPDATLVYADGPTRPVIHTVRGAKIRLHVRHLDLRQDPDHVLSQIRELSRELVTGTGHHAR